MRYLSLLLFSFLPLQSLAFDGVHHLTCAGAKGHFSIQIYDNTSNGTPVVQDTFAIVYLTKLSTTRNVSYIIAGQNMEYSVATDGKASFTDKKNGITYSKCVVTGFTEAIKSAP